MVHVEPIADLAQPDEPGIRQNGAKPSLPPDRDHDHSQSAEPDPDKVPGPMPDRAVSQMGLTHHPADGDIKRPLEPEEPASHAGTVAIPPQDKRQEHAAQKRIELGKRVEHDEE